MKLSALPSWLCRHRWSFPRRWPAFQGHDRRGRADLHEVRGAAAVAGAVWAGARTGCRRAGDAGGNP